MPEPVRVAAGQVGEQATGVVESSVSRDWHVQQELGFAFDFQQRAADRGQPGSTGMRGSDRRCAVVFSSL